MTSRTRAGSESERQWQLLNTHIGLPGSGAVRYAAAMYFFSRDQMPLELLEIYRACSKFDTEDPVAVARFEGITFVEPDLNATESGA